MKRWMPLALAMAGIVLIACADGLPTAASNDLETPALATVAVEEPIAVVIDIKPEAVNTGPIMIKPNNRLAVALLADNPIDIETVDPTTVQLTIDEVVMTPQHDLTKPAAYTSHLKDVYPVELPDGVIDYLVFHFDTDNLESGEFNACLTGIANEGPFEGCEVVTVK